MAVLPPHVYVTAPVKLLQVAVRVMFAPVVPLVGPPMEHVGVVLPPHVSAAFVPVTCQVGLVQPEMVTFWLCATSGAATASIPQSTTNASAINDFVITLSLRAPGRIARAAVSICKNHTANRDISDENYIQKQGL